MQFRYKKRRQPPAVIIISMIDVLMVVLIFLLVTTTFKQQMPSITLALPESRLSKPGSVEQPFIVTIPKNGPIYFGTQPVTMEKLQERLSLEVRRNPQAALAIRADTDAPVGHFIKVMDIAKAANFASISAYTKAGLRP